MKWQKIPYDDVPSYIRELQVTSSNVQIPKMFSVLLDKSAFHQNKQWIITNRSLLFYTNQPIFKGIKVSPLHHSWLITLCLLFALDLFLTKAEKNPPPLKNGGNNSLCLCCDVCTSHYVTVDMSLASPYGLILPVHFAYRPQRAHTATQRLRILV